MLLPTAVLSIVIVSLLLTTAAADSDTMEGMVNIFLTLGVHLFRIKIWCAAYGISAYTEPRKKIFESSQQGPHT